jgi:hypothetical protein
MINGRIDLGAIAFAGKGTPSPGQAGSPALTLAASPLASPSTANILPSAGPPVIQAPASPASAQGEDSDTWTAFARPSPAPPDSSSQPQAAPPIQPVQPPEPETPPAPVTLDSSRDPKEVLDTLFSGQSLDGGYLILFDQGYDPSYFEAVTWNIDGNELGEYASVLDADGNPEKDEWGYDKFSYTPYAEAVIFLDYAGVESGSAHEVTVTITKNGTAYSRTWQVNIP